MKKIIFLITISIAAFGANGQSYETIKTALAINQYKKAKEDLDKGMMNAKFTSKAEAYILKTTIYAGLATELMNINIGMSKDDIIKRLGEPKNTTKTTTSNGTTEMLFYDNYTINLDEKGKVDWIRESGNTSGVKGTNEIFKKMDELTNEAGAAFKKYREMEPEMVLMIDPIYQNGPINLYASYYSSGYNDYTTKKWPASYEKLKKAVEMSDLLISKKMLAITLDTNVLILAGIAAENSGNKEEAVKYYGRLADNKVTGDGFESVYRFLVSHYFAKKDMASFEKYKALGEQLFPKSDYFKYDKIDFAIGLEESFDAKVKALEEVLVTDANNYKANQIMGEIIYDTLNSTIEGAVSPANAADLEKKMIVAFTKSAAAKPGSEIPFIYMGDHFINKAVKVTAAREAHAADMKTRTKPGTMASKEDIAKRDLLDKQYGEALEGARDPYEKAAAIFAAKPKSEDKNQALRDKQQYRKVASYLADVYTYKKIQAKSKPADQAKYAAEEKKWNDLYDSIK